MENVNQLPDIRKTIVINARIEKVWQAVASREGIAGWFMPNTFEPVLGQAFILHAGPFGDSPCTVTVLEPPYRLEFDWDKDWHVSFELKELSEEQTEVTMIHSGWSETKATRFEQNHKDIRGNMENGWEKLIRQKLPAFVESTRD